MRFRRGRPRRMLSDPRAARLVLPAIRLSRGETLRPDTSRYIHGLSGGPIGPTLSGRPYRADPIGGIPTKLAENGRPRHVTTTLLVGSTTVQSEGRPDQAGLRPTIASLIVPDTRTLLGSQNPIACRWSEVLLVATADRTPLHTSCHTSRQLLGQYIIRVARHGRVPHRVSYNMVCRVFVSSAARRSR